MLKAYRYRLFPSDAQAEQLTQLFGCCRFIYNEALAHRKERYQRDKETLTRFALDKRLPALKASFPFLREVYSQCLQQALAHLESAYARFFKTKKGFPRFKSKRDRQAATFPQNARVDFNAATVHLPKIGDIPLALSRTFAGITKTVTVSRTATGKHFVSVLVEDGKEVPQLPSPDASQAIGIDVGLKEFATLSTGQKVANPRRLKASLGRLRRLSQSLSRKKKDSANRVKAKRRLALLHEKVSDQRQDFLHQFTHRLVVDSQATSLCVETLATANLLRNRCLARSIADASWGEFFRQLAYKCQWYGKNLLKAGRFDPSSQVCSACGWRYKTLCLSERQWQCLVCGICHDRDINAARNILRFAFTKVPRGHSESQACGQDGLCPALCAGQATWTKQETLGVIRGIPWL